MYLQTRRCVAQRVIRQAAFFSAEAHPEDPRDTTLQSLQKSAPTPSHLSRLAGKQRLGLSQLIAMSEVGSSTRHWQTNKQRTNNSQVRQLDGFHIHAINQH